MIGVWIHGYAHELHPAPMTNNVLEVITAVRRKGLMIHEPEEEEEEGRSSRKQGHSEQAPHQHTIHWMMGVSSIYYLPKALPEIS